MGWTPRTIREASLAEMWACWVGWARGQGLLRDEVEPMTRSRLRDLMERYPDG